MIEVYIVTDNEDNLKAVFTKEEECDGYINDYGAFTFEKTRVVI